MAAQAIAQGSDPEEALGPGIKVIPFGTIRAVKANLFTAYLSIRFTRADNKPFVEEIGFESSSSRDLALRKIEDRLVGGFKFKRETKQYGRLRAAMAPLITGSVLLFFTWLVHRAAVEVAMGTAGEVQSVKEHRVFGILSILGPTGVLLLGGFSLVLAAGWLVARLIKPPHMALLKPDKAPRIVR
jgi:hypothetical protein